MPITQLVFYRADDARVPVLEFFRELLLRSPKAYAVCLAKLRLLAAFGHQLRRPHVDYLRDGIFELRARHKTVQYRILFFYHGKDIAVLAHALTKESAIPEIDIERAIGRRISYEKAPQKHQAIEPLE